jgi:hypothetical protein
MSQGAKNHFVHELFLETLEQKSFAHELRG